MPLDTRAVKKFFGVINCVTLSGNRIEESGFSVAMRVANALLQYTKY